MVPILVDGERAAALAHVHAAVDADDLAGDRAGVVGAEERAGGGDVVGGADPADRDEVLDHVHRRDLARATPAWAIGVSTIDGGMVLAVMPSGERSTASDLVERDDAALRRHVVGAVGRTGLGARRGDGDDAAPAGGDHVGHAGLDAVERAGEVDPDGPVPARPG